MVLRWAHVDRIVLLAILASLSLSTGLAGAVPQGWDAVTGHTSYVTGVLYLDAPEPGELPPILYGLASHREMRLFGLWKVDEAIPKSQDRMVFVWSEAAPDPRDEATLHPSGEFARVRDRMGVHWTVYEFRYVAEDALHHAYGVRIGDTHRADEAVIGEEGRYNYVLTYRPERLLAAPLAPEVPIPAPGTGGPESPVLDLDSALASIHALRVEALLADPEAHTPKVVVGQGETPESLRAHDPAPKPPRIDRA